MGEDAATTARRIVDEVLARHGAREADAAPERVVEPAGEAARIARRIVEEVLATSPAPAEPAPAEPAVEDPAPADPAPVEPAPAEPARVEDASDLTETGSAAEIVRGIVADVQTEEDLRPGDHDTEAGDADERTRPLPEQREPGEGASLAVAPDGDEVDPATTPLPVGAGPVTSDATSEAEGAAPGADARSLVGWAVPEQAASAPAPAPADEESASAKTLRWLLASLLGAVALAVLFPLAVAALRALVAMDS